MSGFSGAAAAPPAQTPAQSSGGFAGGAAPAALGPIQVFDTYMAPNIGVKALIYGKAGIGKTRFCASAPSPLIISAEGGLLSLRKMHVAAIAVGSIAQLRAARDYCMGPKGQQYLTICLDSITEIAERTLTFEQAATSNGQRAYGDMAKEILTIFREFRDLPRHVIFTAQMGNYKDQLTGGVMYGPSFPGQQLDQKVPYMFDEMFQLHSFKNVQTGEDYTAVRTRPDNQYEAKDRSGALDPWEYPDATNVFNKIMGS